MGLGWTASITAEYKSRALWNDDSSEPSAIFAEGEHWKDMALSCSPVLLNIEDIILSIHV